jgi:hypothetical protein
MFNHSNELPQEVLGILPDSPIGMIELANKIISFAYSQKVGRLF